ncbi:MAG: hypothetical protein HFG27_11675 [Provencibacterium sp.]|jgi:electron transport complex protein RnfA|nr:hypothetical protein [Provencibacterium sp.]
MDSIVLFFLYALTAILMENAIFTRILGSGQIAFFGSLKNILLHSCLLTLFTTLCSFISFFINRLLYDYTVSTTERAFCYLIGIALLYLLFYLGCDQLLPIRLRAVKQTLSVSAFNCAVLGSMILAANLQNSLSSTLGYGIGTGIGYMLALLLIYFGRRRLELIALPRAFKGLPILLLYIGLISLAVYGMIGHQLPT